jgi:hypothetical protein
VRARTAFTAALLAALLSTAAGPAGATPPPEPGATPKDTSTSATRITTPKAPKPTTATPVGYDVSWPQCGITLPTGAAFAIVGVNGGLANNTNPCLGVQLAWAAGSLGGTSQPKAALYVNTANPAEAVASWWPSSNTYPAGAPTPVPNPYGTCTGIDGPACSYMYGYAKAFDNGTLRGVPNPKTFFWWLDVETENSWGPDPVANRAVLEGMTHYYLDVLGAAGVGIYSTGYQWTQIVGGLGAVGSSNLNGLPSWLAGATSLTGAQANCTRTPLTGGKVTVTQYVLKGLDHNYACA